MTTLQLHPLCTFFPRMEGQEYEELKADIKANGLRQRIVVHKGMILDGGNRYRACLEVSVAPLTMDYNGSDPVSFVMSQNLHRRHLQPGQRAVIVAAASDWTKAHGHGGDRKSAQSAALHLDSASDRAAQSGASLRTQKDADKVTKADPKLAKQVAQGKVSLPKAVKQINGHAKTDKPPAIHGDVVPDDGGDDPIKMMERDAATIHKQQVQLDALTQTDQAKELLKQIDMRKDAERELGVKMDMVAARDKDLKSWANWFEKVSKLTKLEKRSEVLSWIQERAQ